MARKLLSICIPTRNRASELERLLNNVISQALEFRDDIEICISNNNSNDNTKDIVINFREKYPDLIKYHENESNIGLDRNILKLSAMAEGKFIWTFGDDDLIEKKGLKKVIEFITEKRGYNIGAMIINLKHCRVLDAKGHTLFKKAIDTNESDEYELTHVNAIQSATGSITCTILNSELVKKILKHNRDLVKKGISLYYMHKWLYILIFLLNKEFKCCVLNKNIVAITTAIDKAVVEDDFDVLYNGCFKLNDELISILGNEDISIDDENRNRIINTLNTQKKNAKIRFVQTIILTKMFGKLNYKSYTGCIRLFFKKLAFVDAMLFSVTLVINSMVPAAVSKGLYKIYLKIRYGKKAESQWAKIYSAGSLRGTSERRYHF